MESRIVILDEEPAVRAQLKRLLRTANPHWEVLEARNDADALALLIKDDVNVLLADDEDLVGRARKLSENTVCILMTHPEVPSIDRHGRRLPKATLDVALLAEVADAAKESDERRWVEHTVARFLSPAFMEVRS